MRSTRCVPSVAAVVALVLSPALVTPVAAQSSEVTVLVAPLTLGEGVHQNFGKDVAKAVRKALESVGGVTAIDDGDVNDFLDQYGLKADNLSPIEWRQMGSQMSASLVMSGEAKMTGSVIEVDVTFIDPRNGDELPVAPFTVADRRQDDEAAEMIVQGLNVQMEYFQSVAFCSEYLASEQVSDALRNCDRAIEINPVGLRPYYLRGRARMLEEAWGAAEQDLQRVVDGDPSNTEALQSLAYTYAQLGNAEASARYYREYLNFNPNDSAVRLRVAFDLAQAGGYSEAMAILQDGVQRDPDNVDLLQYLGSVALSAGQSNGEVTDAQAIRTSVDAFEKVLEAKGDEVDAAMLTNVVNANMLIEDYEAALRFADRAIDLINNPRPAADDSEAPSEPAASRQDMLASVYSARANVYQRLERYSDAASSLEQALQYNPALPNGYQRLALFKLQAGDSDGAITDFRTAVQQGADSNQIAEALFGRGYNDDFQQGRHLEAIGLFDVALEFAKEAETSQKIHFFAAYGYYLRGTNIDEGNQQAEACGPARSALAAFQNVLPHLNQAGGYQANNQGQIRQAVDTQLYRQEQIIQKSCK